MQKWQNEMEMGVTTAQIQSDILFGAANSRINIRLVRTQNALHISIWDRHWHVDSQTGRHSKISSRCGACDDGVMVVQWAKM